MINVLVHPFYGLYRSWEYLEPIPLHRRLFADKIEAIKKVSENVWLSWAEKIRAISRKQSEVLFFFPTSSFSRSEVKRLLKSTQPQKPDLELVALQEQARLIVLARRLLGKKRVFVFHRWIYEEYANTVRKIFEKRGFTANPEKTVLQAFGERATPLTPENFCVPAISNRLKKAFNLKKAVIDYSLSVPSGIEGISKRNFSNRAQRIRQILAKNKMPFAELLKTRKRRLK